MEPKPLETPSAPAPSASAPDLSAPAGDAPLLRIELVPLDECRKWDRNPKKHELGDLARSIRRYGFRDAPIFDATLGAIVAGNGRIAALERLRAGDHPAPEGIRVVDGRWLVPIQMGVDAASREEAEAFAVDHNNLVVAPLGPKEMAALWEEEGLREVLADLKDAELDPVTLELDDLETDLEEAELDPAAQLDGLEFRVIVECDGEEHQAELLARFGEEGLKCRALTS